MVVKGIGVPPLETRTLRAARIRAKKPAWRYTNALSPVMALPTISVFISRVPS
jgi:hypothetical protein